MNNITHGRKTAVILTTTLILSIFIGVFALGSLNVGASPAESITITEPVSNNPTSAANGATCGMWVHGIETGGNTQLYNVWGNNDGTLVTTPTNTELTGVGRAGGFGSQTEATFPSDVNGDGLTDWVHATESAVNDTYFYVYLGQNDGTYATTAVTTHITSGAPDGLAGNDATTESTFMGDVNNDGRADWVHGIQPGQSATLTNLYVLFGQTDGTFAAPVATNDTATNYGLAGGWNTNAESSFVGDINGDGYADWVHAWEAAPNNTHFYTLLANSDGSGTFVTPAIYTNVTTAPNGLVGNNATSEASFIGDVDNDGYADWIHAIEIGGNSTELYAVLGTSTGNFNTTPVNTTLPVYLVSGNVSDIESSFAADITGDGRADWVHGIEGGGNTSFYVFTGNADGTFATTAVQTTPVGGYTGNNATTESTFIGAGACGGTSVSDSCYATIDGSTVYSSSDSQAVRDAITASSDGDTIKIAGYCAGVDSGSLATVSSNITLQGGYTTTNWTTSDPVANPTTLDGENNGRLVSNVTSDINITINGLRLINGTTSAGGAVANSGANVVINIGDSYIADNTSTGTTSTGGGALFMWPGLANISNTTFENNSSADHGGAIFLRGGGEIQLTNTNFYTNTAPTSSSMITSDGPITMTGGIAMGNTTTGGCGIVSANAQVSNAIFTANTAAYGGAICLGVGSTVVDSDFINNTAGYGGALSANGGTITGCEFRENVSTSHSGAIYNVAAMTINNTDFISNTATTGGGIYTTMGITVTNSSFISNTATIGQIAGGAIYLGGGTSNISDSAFTGNNVGITTPNVDGGAIYNASTLTIDSSTFTQNASAGPTAEGGAIFNAASATITITASTFSHNYGDGGGGWGGGAVLNTGAATIANSTFYSNTTGQYGSAISQFGGTLMAINNTFSENSQASGATVNVGGGSAYLSNNIIANTLNSADCTGTLATNTNNLIEDGSCSPAVSGDPMLGTLEYTGLGNTGVLPLLAGSPAINAADTASAPATDQRGVARPQSCAADIGSYESSFEDGCIALSLSKTAVNITGAPLIAGDIIEYVVTVTNELGSSQAGIVITDAIPAHTTYVAGSASVTQGAVSSPDPLVADIGTLAADASATLTFRVTVDEDASGETIQNSAQASSPDQPDPIEVGPIEPDGGGLVSPSADLAISQSIEIDVLQTIFTIEVDNNGPNAAPGAVISVTFPADFENITWTCSASSGAVCPHNSGSGNTINETATTFPTTGNLTYTVTTSIWKAVTNKAEIIPPAHVIDPDMTNNVSEQISRYVYLFPIVFNSTSFTP